MFNLNGILPVELIHEVDSYTDLRLKDKYKYKCAEALALYEQKLMPEEDLFKLCEETVGEKLSDPVPSYVPEDIIMDFAGTGLVPVSYSPMSQLVTCVTMPEINTTYVTKGTYKVVETNAPIYIYFREYIRKYGRHSDLLDMPVRQLLDGIVNEAIMLDAADITISTTENLARVYYNVRKSKVYSNRILSADDIYDIIKLLCVESPMDSMSNNPKYVGVSLTRYYRGRVVINHKYHGYEITIRLLPNAAFSKKLEDCNLTRETIEFFRKYFMDRELGLRLIVGSTMSGKNTTALACLNETVKDDLFKVVSIEMPVEQELNGIEQINCDNEEEYDLNINSLLRQNPDLVYITEMGDTTAKSIMRVTNTGKRVISTLHANSCSDVIGRLMDITQLSPDRIIQTLHSIVYQELIRIPEEDRVVPKNRYIYLSQDRKVQLYGKPYGEIITKLREWEGGDIW